MLFRLLLLIGLLALGACPAAAVEGSVIVYGLHTSSEEGFQRILSEKSVRYVCTQQIVSRGGVPSLARERAAALTKAGKRVILQIWWGPAGDFPWTKYSFANIALDPAIRAEFFRDVVDPCIGGYGAGNLYGVHLMEETGMQFGTDLIRRGDPDNFTDFEEPTSSYQVPFWSGYGSLPGAWKIANVRRHEADFTRMTGLRFADAERWGLLEHHLFDRWVSTRLQSGGQVEFAKHIRQKYPRLKRFTWDILRTGDENPRTDFHLENRYFDGVICDVYNDVGFNYLYQRAYRLLCPKAEIIHFAMGGMGQEQGYPYASPDRKRALTLGAVLAGVDGVGFFESPSDYSRPDAWKTNVEIFRRLQPVPRFRKQPPVILLANSVSNIYSCTWAWTGLKYFDFLPTQEAHSVNLDPYQVMILHVDGPVTDSRVFWNSNALKEKYGLPGHVDHRTLDRFVARGGLLILSGQARLDEDCPLAVAREGYLRTQGVPAGLPEALAVSPSGWLRETAGLEREYRFSVYRIPVTADPKRVVTTEAGHFLRYGKGAVFFFPYNRVYDPQEPYDSPQWRQYRQLLNDVASGVLRHLGRGAIARDYFSGPREGSHQMEAVSDDGVWAGYLLRESGAMAGPQRQLSGNDILTGEPALLGGTRTSALVRRSQARPKKRRSASDLRQVR